MIGAVKRFEVVIVGSNWEDRQTLELLEAPRENDTIETRYGTCVVTSVEPSERGDNAGRIFCRLP
jgi:hypothetical protein